MKKYNLNFGKLVLTLYMIVMLGISGFSQSVKISQNGDFGVCPGNNGYGTGGVFL